MTKQELMETVAERFSVDPEYPWEKIESGYVFRRRDNRKWFGMGMAVPYARLGLERDGSADVFNVKCGPLLQGSYLSHPGILPAYHMNKTHWLSILLDGSADDDVIRELLDLSYDLTGPRRKTARQGRSGEASPDGTKGDGNDP